MCIFRTLHRKSDIHILALSTRNSNPQDLSHIANYMIEFSNWAIESYDKFDIDEEIYGNVKEKYRMLHCLH